MGRNQDVIKRFTDQCAAKQKQNIAENGDRKTEKGKRNLETTTHLKHLQPSQPPVASRQQQY